MYSITIKNSYLYQGELIFGLDVKGNCPVFIGCTFRTLSGTEIDHPGEWLESEGLALFETSLTGEQINQFRQPKGIIFTHPDTFAGEVMFALWRDDSFTNRLADTGWWRWQRDYLGDKGFSFKRQFERSEMMNIYGDRLDVWR